MTMHDLRQNLPVLTVDEYRLGQLHTLYHRDEVAEPQHNLFPSYLMVVNLTIGDDYYVPTTYIDNTRRGETAVWLTLTRADIQNKQLTRTPQFIVDDRFTEEPLPKDGTSAATIPEVGKPLNRQMPLPPNLRSG